MLPKLKRSKQKNEHTKKSFLFSTHALKGVVFFCSRFLRKKKVVKKEKGYFFFLLYVHGKTCLKCLPSVVAKKRFSFFFSKKNNTYFFIQASVFEKFFLQNQNEERCSRWLNSMPHTYVKKRKKTFFFFFKAKKVNVKSKNENIKSFHLFLFLEVETNLSHGMFLRGKPEKKILT
jgi:hypothetical protein